jgi:hypothetical protein
MLRAPRKPREELKRLIEDLGEAIGKNTAHDNIEAARRRPPKTITRTTKHGKTSKNGMQG